MIRRDHMIRITTAAMLAVLATTASAWDWHYVATAERVSGGAHFGVDGSAFVVLRDQNELTNLRRIAADGSLAWSVPLADSGVSASIDSNATRVCVALALGPTFSPPTPNYDLSISCHDIASGTLIYRRNGISGLEPPVYSRLHVADNGAVTDLYVLELSVRRVQLNAVGETTSDILIHEASQYGILALQEDGFADDGSFVVTRRGTNVEYSIIAADGRIAGRFSASSLGLVDPVATVAPDGTIFVSGSENTATGHRAVALKLGATGNQIWRTNLLESTIGFDTPTLGDGAVFFALGTEQGPRVVTEFALDYATGATRWHLPVPEDRYLQYPRRVVSANGDTVVSALHLDTTIRVQSRRATDGAIVRDDAYYIAEFAGLNQQSPIAINVDVNDALRFITARNDVLAASDITAPIPTFVAAQHGIRGAWNIGTDGEGIVIDYDPASRTLFAPWFTNTHESSSIPVNVHWFSLQGTLAENARSAAVTIYETRGGAFATGAPIAPVAVGTGTFTFSSCDAGTLLYDFDEGTNDGAAGLLGLTRLTPRTDACIDVRDDGTTTSPPTVAAGPIAGFRSAYSGTWSQVGSAGQGIEFVVQPGDFVSGAWFTFDPAELPNDPAKQHWFTLSGDLATATSGTVTVTLYQRYGGRYDEQLDFVEPPVAVGTAALHFIDCETATLDYDFYLNAGRFINRAGRVTFEHLGGCTAAP